MKDAAITEVLDQLRSSLGDDAFDIADHWADDLAAIGITSRSAPGRLAYISTANTGPGRYDLALELPPMPNSDSPYAPAGSADNVDFDTLAVLIGRHFNGEHLDLQANDR